MEILKTRRDVARPDRPALTVAKFLSGSDFQSVLSTYSIDVQRVRAFRRVDSQAAAGPIPISNPLESPEPIVCGQPDANGVISWYSAADRVFLNEDASGMFYYFLLCTRIDLSGVSSASTRDFSMMFSVCPSLETLDISGFSTANATNMVEMFDGCGNLRTIYARTTFVAPAISTRMFAACPSLVGGSGTAYDALHTDGEYARIDNPPAAPGYFTEPN